MVSIFKNTYAVSTVVSDKVIVEGYPDRIILGSIGEALDGLYHAAVDKGETLDWATLAISTRHDGLLDGLIIATRINSV